MLGYYSFPGSQFSYVSRDSDISSQAQNQQIFDFVKEALASFDASHDFAQYDNDNDGDIDSLTILYAGQRGAWSSFWWAYQWSFYINESQTTRFDGKRLNSFVFQSIDVRNNGTDMQPRTLIHETGHLLGFPDLYDYKQGSGQEGGVGGFDIMDSNQGNPNGFLRWIADWIQPDIISAGASSIRTLRASGDRTGQNQNKATVIFPGIGQSPFQEFYMVENRHRVGNDGNLSNLPSDGLAIWHIDATLNNEGSNFAFSNTDVPAPTAHKLVRLVQADGLAQIENTTNGGRLDAGDYYIRGRTLTPTTNPNSNAYNGSATGIRIEDISANGPVMTARIGFGGAATQPNIAAGTSPTTVSPLSLTQGANLTIGTSVQNTGAAPAAASIIRFFLSRNPLAFSPDILLGEASTAGLAVGENRPLPGINFPIPTNVTAGQYGVGWILDAGGAVSETLESDNTVFAGDAFTVTVNNGGTSAPDIAITGGTSSAISPGDTTPDEATGTLFGNINVGTTTTRSFTVRNLGTAPLTLTGGTPLTIGGSGAGQFSIITPPATSITPASSTSFTVRFAPTSSGTKTATLTLSSSDPDTPTYTFTISGSGTSLTDDHGGSVATATTVASSSSTPGTLETQGDQDIFRITVATSGTLSVSTAGASDTYGTLIGPNGTTTIQEDDDTGPSLNFQIQAVVSPGTYFVQIRGFTRTGTGGAADVSAVGPYTFISAFQPNVSADDHGNTLATATILAPGATAPGVLEIGGDLDVFRISIPSAGTIALQTTGTIDTFGTLTDASGNILTTDDDGGITVNFSIGVQVVPGDYFLFVSGFSSDTTGSYELASIYTPVTAIPDDHGDTAGTATPIFANGFVPGRIGTPGDVDFFQITVFSSGILTVYTTGETDTFGTVHNNPASQNISDDDGGPLLNFELDLTIPGPGTYTISASGFGTSVGDYSLITHFSSDPFLDDHWNGPGDFLENDQLFINATIVAPNSFTNGFLGAPGDTDYFYVELPSPGILSVSTIGNTDTFGFIREANGIAFTSDDDSGSGSNFGITSTLAAGIYYIHVEGYQLSATGAYTLGLNFVPDVGTDDHANVGPGATTLPGGSSTTAGTIERDGDLDYFSFTLTSASLVTIGTTGTTDTIGSLSDTAGNEYGVNDDANTTNRNFSLARELSPGTYYVIVRGYNATTGNYDLVLNVEEITVPAGSFAITSITRAPSGAITVTFPSSIGQNYTLERSPNLKNPWTPVQINVPGTGAPLALSHSNPGTSTTGYYRVSRSN